jgi:predicted nucleotidyltransferase component of viral defense system
MSSPAGLIASIRQKLLNIADRTGDDANHIWSRYAVERLLYRLSISEFSADFVLKGAALFTVWAGESHRPTMDLDLLAFGEDSQERVLAVFRQLCAIDIDSDGISFDAESIRVIPIREDAEYHGRRVSMTAHLGKATIPVQVDIGFGDVVTPRAEVVDFPTLLDMPAPRIRACPRPTVVAEKFHAMIILGIANSRMKDFYDLYTLTSRFEFDGAVLCEAIKATFARRKTEVPREIPTALGDEFLGDNTKLVQWKAFVRKIGGENSPSFGEVIERLRCFFVPVMNAISGHGHAVTHWSPGGPWA